MDIITDFIGFLLEMWESHWSGKIIVVIFVSFMAAVLGAIIYYGGRKVHYLVTRKRCSHCQEWTTLFSTGKFTNCAAGPPCCHDCQIRHKMDGELKLRCPDCGTVMEKILTDGHIVDRCPDGHGRWLSEKEYKSLTTPPPNSGIDATSYLMGFAGGSLLP